MEVSYSLWPSPVIQSWISMFRLSPLCCHHHLSELCVLFHFLFGEEKLRKKIPDSELRLYVVPSNPLLDLQDH